MKIGEIVNFKCEYIASDGKGVMKNPDFVFYVPYLLPGEEAKVCVLNIKNKNVYGDIVEIISTSKDRIVPPCPHFKNCGSCQLLHMNYEREIKLKEGMLSFLFKRPGVKVFKMIDNFNYRQKTVISFGVKNKKMVVGFYEEGSHKIVETKGCLIQDKRANKINEAIVDIMQKQHIEAYSDNRGTMRHVLIRTSKKEIMVVLVVGDEMFPGRNNFVKELLSRNLGITTIIQNYNPRETSIILGDKERILYGKGYIIEELCEKKFKISPSSFFQVNPMQAEYLFSIAIRMAEVNKNDVVLDAYCGTGIISIIMAAQAKRVIGVEENKEAIEDAINNKKANGASNVEFYNVNVERFMSGFTSAVDVVFLDPPRDGCSDEFINSLIKLNPKKIIYISCNPLTQIGDIAKLSNYNVIDVQGVDMFPHTLHVESIALLERK